MLRISLMRRQRYKVASKLTYDYVRDQFSKEGYILLSDTYYNSRRPLSVLCPNGHKTDTLTYDNFRSGKRCRLCSSNAEMTIGRVKAAFESRGYQLLSTNYTRAAVKLDYICDRGHTNSISWNNFQMGHGCPDCYGNTKLNIEVIRESFRDKGAVLLTKVYKNNKTKLRYICSSGHEHSISWDNWQAGHGCPICAGNFKYDIKAIKEEFRKAGYDLLSNEYKSNKHKLLYKCGNGHVHSMSYGKFKYGRRCPTCATINLLGPNNHNWKGGVSLESYCEAWKDKEYKSSIKERDGHKCLNPYCCSRNPNDLTIHHIDYNKKNCSLNNLITVCRSCNSVANSDREWHTAWYKAVIYRRYINGR